MLNRLAMRRANGLHHRQLLCATLDRQRKTGLAGSAQGTQDPVRPRRLLVLVTNPIGARPFAYDGPAEDSIPTRRSGRKQDARRLRGEVAGTKTPTSWLALLSTSGLTCGDAFFGCSVVARAGFEPATFGL